MVENSLEKLRGECKIKMKVLQAVVRLKYPRLAPYETFRSRARQAWLYTQLKGKWPVAKPGTSYHEAGKAVDWIFLNSKWQPTRKGDYAYVQYVATMCGLRGVKWESCHTEYAWKTIVATMKNNSARYNKSKSSSEQKLLSAVNTAFRKYWYK
jgi:hypothetical protein